MLRHLDLFSGIGGFALGLQWAGGFETVGFCEIEKYAQSVLRQNFPGIPIYEDIRTLDAARLGRIDVITGGYPCQPFSTAGKRKGAEDDRHLWPEMLRIIKSCKPRWVIGENVAGHISMGLDEVLSDLENENYTTRTFIIPACATDAPHRRDRVWIIANVEHTECDGQLGTAGPSFIAEAIRQQSQREGPALDIARASSLPAPEVHVADPDPRQCTREKQELRPGRNTVDHGSEALAYAHKSGQYSGSGYRSSHGEERHNIGGSGEIMAHAESEGSCGLPFRTEPENTVFGVSGENGANSFQSRLEGFTGYVSNRGQSGWIGETEVRSACSVHLRTGKEYWATEPSVGRVAHGVPRRVDRIKALGNAVVPQIPFIIGSAIMEVERCNSMK